MPVCGCRSPSPPHGHAGASEVTLSAGAGGGVRPLHPPSSIASPLAPAPPPLLLPHPLHFSHLPSLPAGEVMA
ncbi:glutamate receptor ionotropic, NMDA 2B isoform X1 [Lates japonicus]|uniref:Glutamate receptor ionotropic, NMDA 2B isoform X1 n=1 Tax=Lates japonicus TaxID=270547 RepID=A0AAD3R984_LATJO|nr:glutamate receptor ionotropic, NMDA 2B isoform X1 [Lates japonicus]